MPLNVDLINGGTIKTDSFIGNSISATTYLNLPSDIFVTGYTYSNNTFTLERTIGLPNLSTTIDVVTGLTVSGTLTATTISGATFYGDGSNLTGVGVPYKIYSALLTQSGTTDPVVTIIENTLGIITINRDSTGRYSVNSSGLFTSNKTIVYINTITSSAGPYGGYASISNNSQNTIYIDTTKVIGSGGGIPGTGTDTVLNNTSFEVRVYN